MPALLRDWTPERDVSIDWSNVDDIAAQQLSLGALVAAHPELRKLLGEPTGAMAQTFLDRTPAAAKERAALLGKWVKDKRFTARAARWCRACGGQGHTKLRCSAEAPPRSDPLARFQALKKEREAAEFKTQLANQGKPRVRDERVRPARAAHPADELTWHRGTVKSLNPQLECGDVTVQVIGVLNFFMDRADYGLKKIRVGDEVRLRVERVNDRAAAVDLKPIHPTLTAEDVQALIRDCEDSHRTPIQQLRVLLEQQHNWHALVAVIAAGDRAAVNVLIRLTTFAPNRLAINAPVLGAFLTLMQSRDADTNAAFFPDMVKAAIPSIADEVGPQTIDMLMETADLVMLMRSLGNAPAADVGAVATVLRVAVQDAAAVSPAPAAAKKLRWISQTIDTVEKDDAAKLLVIPSAAELSKPPSDRASVFHPQNLPVNVATRYASTEAYISAQCQLLRADTFSSTARILAAACFKLPKHTIDGSTAEDVKHTRRFSDLQYLGRTASKERDEDVLGYIFQMTGEPCEARPNGQLEQGQLLCITTGQDRTVIEEDELFWGTVAVKDPKLSRSNVTVVYPSFGKSFEQLVARLARNAAAGTPELSMALEVPVFTYGYVPVVKAMSQFLGINAMPLPLADVIVQEQDERRAALVPGYYARTFDRIVAGIKKPLVLDPGQDAVLTSLRTSPVSLVQGPPGTGKSFVGCRVVEALIRLKRAVSSGAALPEVDVAQLPDCKPETLVPPVGPILVITYKNHALDEFLVDLIKSGLWCDGAREKTGCSCTGVFSGCCDKCCTHHKPVVRIGSRSQAPELQPYQVHEVMLSQQAPRDFAQARFRSNVLQRKVERLAAEIRGLEKGAVTKEVFATWLTPEQAASIAHADVEAWLAGDRYIGREATAVDTPFPTHFENRIYDVLARPAPAPAAAADGEEPEEGQQPTVFAAMKAEMARETGGPRGMTDATVKSIVGSESLALGARGAGPSPIADGLQSLWSLAPQQRHDYFAYRLKAAIAVRVREYTTALKLLETSITVMSHSRECARLNVLRSVDVIGLTTTGCAMNQNLLRSLAPSVLIVEEAAEILESQLVACMTESIKQVILIGDHYQLQPKVETVALEKVNRLNVSMFERLVKHIKPIVLVEQRRMRSGIADLIRPFYKAQPFTDHRSIAARPFFDAACKPHVGAVPGLKHEVFFWDHDAPEEAAYQGRSKINAAEVVRTRCLVQHLLAEGVRPQSIVVITPYLGQKREITQRLAAARCGDIRVSTVARFQGDEGDVVILSLVRTKTMTDFIRMRNRMIVACSRARFAMVVLGSVALLKQSPHWKILVEALEQAAVVGRALPLRCGDADFVEEDPTKWPHSAM
jgi:hypothetical protein